MAHASEITYFLAPYINSYKRFQAGNSDDEYLGLFDRGVPMLAEKAREIAHS